MNFQGHSLHWMGRIRLWSNPSPEFLKPLGKINCPLVENFAYSTKFSQPSPRNLQATALVFNYYGVYIYLKRSDKKIYSILIVAIVFLLISRLILKKYWNMHSENRQWMIIRKSLFTKSIGWCWCRKWFAILGRTKTG